MIARVLATTRVSCPVFLAQSTQIRFVKPSIDCSSVSGPVKQQRHDSGSKTADVSGARQSSAQSTALSMLPVSRSALVTVSTRIFSANSVYSRLENILISMSRSSDAHSAKTFVNAGIRALSLGCWSGRSHSPRRVRCRRNGCATDPISTLLGSARRSAGANRRMGYYAIRVRYGVRSFGKFKKMTSRGRIGHSCK